MALIFRSNTGNGAYATAKKELQLRKIVHALLLSSGDSVSVIQPLQRISPNEYSFAPAKSLAVHPDSFVNIINRMVKRDASVLHCVASVRYKRDGLIAYGYETANTPADQASCLGRPMPKDDYYFSFVFPAAGTVIWKKLYAMAAPALLFVAALLWVRLKKPAVEKSPFPSPDSQQELAETEGTAENAGMRIGKFWFSPAQQQLIFYDRAIALTAKESQVLELLSGSVNNVVERERLQKEIWENEGVIVTRSLDMFISKLRKKLSDDDGVKIINVHGKGYKLTVPSGDNGNPSQ